MTSEGPARATEGTRGKEEEGGGGECSPSIFLIKRNRGS